MNKGPFFNRLSPRQLEGSVRVVDPAGPDSPAVVARRQEPFSAEASRTEPIGFAWLPGVISLSHVALPFPLDDPLYGQRQGERGVLRLPPEWLLRLRHNPFYPYLEAQVVGWLERAGVQTAAK